MKDDKNHDEIKENTTVETPDEEAVDQEVPEEEFRIDVDELSEEEARAMLNEALDANKDLTAENDELTKKLATAQAEAAANKDSWYRCAAEFENFKKRNADARQTAYFDGKKDAITSLLIIGDSVDRALSVVTDEKTKEGVMLIKRQFKETLDSLSVEEIDPVGQPFDPTVAEAIATVDAAEGEESGTVKTVFKKGYKLNGKMLRYAQVVVIQ